MRRDPEAAFIFYWGEGRGGVVEKERASSTAAFEMGANWSVDLVHCNPIVREFGGINNGKLEHTMPADRSLMRCGTVLIDRSAINKCCKIVR